MKLDVSAGAAFVLFVLILFGSITITKVFGPAPDCPTPIESSK
jgi:hypothetical protein